MDRPYLDPFLAVVPHVLGIDVDISTVAPCAPIATDHEFVVTIDCSGATPGSVTGRFPRTTAHRLASLFAARVISADADADIADALGEILDIIAGRALAYPCTRSRPTVTIRRGVDGAVARDHIARSAECFCSAGGFTLAFHPVAPEVGRISPGSPSTIAIHKG